MNLPIGLRNIKAGFLLISMGLGIGLVMSLYAFSPMVPVPGALNEYNDLPRRLIRLGHIAAIMLPLINIIFGLVIDRVRLSPSAKNLASWCLILGAACGPAALFIQAVWKGSEKFHLPAVPFVAFFFGVVVLTVGVMRTGRTAVDPN